MKKQKFIINKNTGEITTVYSDEIENILNDFTDLTVERVSDINFNNETQTWQVHDRKHGGLIIESKTKSKVYNSEAIWADDNLQILAKKYFHENTIN